MNLHRVRRGLSGPSARRTLQTVLGGAAALVLVTACGTGGKSSDDGADLGGWKPPKAVSDALQNEGEIDTIKHDNSSSAIQSELYAQVIRAFGGDAKITQLNDYGSTFAVLSTEKNMTAVEMWTGSAPDAVKQYIDDEKTVDLFEVNDVDRDAAEGWYVPTYVIKGDSERDIEPTCPGLPDWHALNDCVDVFETADSDGEGRYLSGAKSWGPAYGDPERIENLGLDYEVAYAGSEAALQAEWVRAYESGKPILGLMWAPHYLTAKYDLTKVEFPPYSEDCWGEGKSYACDWGPLGVDKLSSAGYRDNYPAAAQILDNYDLNFEQLGEMMTTSVDEGKPAEEVVAEWMEANPTVWQAWGEGADK